MPTRTKTLEMKQIVTNLDLYLETQKFICITTSMNPEALKLEEAATGGVQ